MRITMEKFLPIHRSIYNYTRNGTITCWKLIVEIYEKINRMNRRYFLPTALLTLEG